METEIWERNSFEVEAVRVTGGNIREVAEWCSGEVCRTSSHNSKQYVLVDTVDYNRNHKTKAFVGDWLILVQGQFKHYRDRSIHLAYHRKIETDKEKAISGLFQQALVVVIEDSNVSWEDLSKNFTARAMEIIGREVE
jgi:hypothetical protein